jgi:hypothetical protein
MGNCQAAEVATVVIQHPGEGLTERAYWALSAGAVMAANPGHYVAAVITSPPDPSSSGTGAAPVKHLKLVRPDDTLLLGRVYRLVSFEGTYAVRFPACPAAASSRRCSKNGAGVALAVLYAGRPRSVGTLCARVRIKMGSVSLCSVK